MVFFLETTNVVSNALSSFELAGGSTHSTRHLITVILEFLSGTEWFVIGHRIKYTGKKCRCNQLLLYLPI